VSFAYSGGGIERGVSEKDFHREDARSAKGRPRKIFNDELVLEFLAFPATQRESRETIINPSLSFYSLIFLGVLCVFAVKIRIFSFHASLASPR